MREKSQATFLFTIILALLLIGAKLAHAHEWYTGQHNPGNGQSCCGGNDCLEIPLEWVTEDADNYIVNIPSPVPNFPGLTATYHPGPYAIPKVEAQPTQHIDADGKEHSGYHACIWGGKLRCFFYPQFT